MFALIACPDIKKTFVREVDEIVNEEKEPLEPNMLVDFYVKAEKYTGTLVDTGKPFFFSPALLSRLISFCNFIS